MARVSIKDHMFNAHRTNLTRAILDANTKILDTETHPVGNNYMPVPSPDKWGGVRKEIANYLTILQKYLMDQYNQISSDMVLESETPGLESTYHITRDERERISSSEGIYDVDGTNPSGLPPADVAQSKRKRLRFTTTIHNIGTWNVRGMNIGKLEIIKQEMQRLHIDLLGISELHWTGNEYFKSDEYTVVYSGNDTIKRNGMAFIATKAPPLNHGSTKICTKSRCTRERHRRFLYKTPRDNRPDPSSRNEGCTLGQHQTVYIETKSTTSYRSSMNFENRWVLKSALNFASDGEVVREVGREFQRKGPEKAKADLAKECLTPVKKKREEKDNRKPGLSTHNLKDVD
ncbi:hypothetical protein HELRODRAFT_164986 [Helobdella robusta]|uniref:Endonuclease/exonuclease/phosphatase domain-containing protein n=1 Tax=Helobdella robusta TaxID=6412 RepID=T1EW26_HELRO|nr:hypothetical protein HELRODRAFT_164986 [Helobdella robusta]ESN92855.1 hypothetical protein HELRODRAFT_164986 [Helobdella robusta]